MMEQEMRPMLSLVRKPLHDRFSDARMEILAAAAQESVIGRLLHQNVLEGVTCIRGRAGPKYQFRPNKFRQRRLQSDGGLSGDLAEHLMAELATDDSADLRQLPPALQPVEASHKRGL